MSDQSPPSPTTPQRRRSSFAEMFTSRPSMSSSTTPPSTSVSASLPRTQHTRGASVSTSTKGLGLLGVSPEQSPFSAFAKQRQASTSTSSGTGSPEFRNSFSDEPAVIDDDATNAQANTPSSPSFARRMSFGAQALRDVKQGGGSGSGGGEGFTWSDAFRDKTKRSPSFSSSANPFVSNPARNRSTSVSASSSAPEPPKEMPKPAPAPAPTPQKFKKPDHLGERMLRGEFMMD